MLALVGILGMFNNRPIIVGVLTLAYATLGLVFASAGIFVARRKLFASAGQTVLAGAMAGLLAGAIVGVLPIAMDFINLPTIFVALRPHPYQFLPFSRRNLAAGLHALLPLRVSLGAGVA